MFVRFTYSEVDSHFVHRSNRVLSWCCECISCYDVMYVHDIDPSDRHEMDCEQTVEPKSAISSDIHVDNRSLQNNFQPNRYRLLPFISRSNFLNVTVLPLLHNDYR